MIYQKINKKKVRGDEAHFFLTSIHVLPRMDRVCGKLPEIPLLFDIPHGIYGSNLY